MCKDGGSVQTWTNFSRICKQADNLCFLYDKATLIKRANNVAVEKNKQVRIQMGVIYDQMQVGPGQ